MKEIVVKWAFTGEGLVLREDNKDTRLIVWDGEVLAIGWLLETIRMEGLISEGTILKVKEAFDSFVEKKKEQLEAGI